MFIVMPDNLSMHEQVAHFFQSGEIKDVCNGGTSECRGNCAVPHDGVNHPHETASPLLMSRNGLDHHADRNHSRSNRTTSNAKSLDHSRVLELLFARITTSESKPCFSFDVAK